MNDSQFQKLLDRTTKAGQKHAKLQTEVGEECRRRYSKHYSDVDADVIIDAIDYCILSITVKQFDSDMTGKDVYPKPPDWED